MMFKQLNQKLFKLSGLTKWQYLGHLAWDCLTFLLLIGISTYQQSPTVFFSLPFQLYLLIVSLNLPVVPHLTTYFENRVKARKSDRDYELREISHGEFWCFRVPLVFVGLPVCYFVLKRVSSNKRH